MTTITTQMVSIPVLWDSLGNFRNNEQVAVNVGAILNLNVSKPDGLYIPGVSHVNYVNTLEVKPSPYIAYYTTLTIGQYLALVGAGSIGPGGIMSITLTGDVEVPAGCTIPVPANMDIQQVSKGGTIIYDTDYTYTNGDPDGTLDITSAGCLSVGEKLQIIYKIA
jgi:hypothetical protein